MFQWIEKFDEYPLYGIYSKNQGLNGLHWMDTISAAEYDMQIATNEQNSNRFIKHESNVQNALNSLENPTQDPNRLHPSFAKTSMPMGGRLFSVKKRKIASKYL